MPSANKEAGGSHAGTRQRLADAAKTPDNSSGHAIGPAQILPTRIGRPGMRVILDRVVDVYSFVINGFVKHVGRFSQAAPSQAAYPRRLTSNPGLTGAGAPQDAAKRQHPMDNCSRAIAPAGLPAGSHAEDLKSSYSLNR
jgi:hypothetical protein